ncbi:antirestriction protein ArdC [Bradyrhizobium retamae]|uniref:Antirestriction protein ArdC n=1 Tax=Bradyrhizobium retamae TaxID=1300035 RepID=A0A0R3MAZ5_9BRAD|nr:antirestriction protein ArdC [Bradyrhizobium retamae]
MAGAFVCASLGIVPTVRHADYIGSWLEVLREDNHAVVRAASAASKAADFLFGFLTPAIDSVVGGREKLHDGSARCAHIGPQLVLRVRE